MLRTKVLDMVDMQREDFRRINDLFDLYFGLHWPEVPLRRWEYVAAILFSEVEQNPGRCLEAGCGHSIFAPFLSKIGCHVDAIDIGLENAIHSNWPPGTVNYRNMSMVDIKFKSNIFDYVFAISSIEHINAGRFAIPGMKFDTGDILAIYELCRVLKPGGVLILTTDFADRYYPPPGLWPSGSHRIYCKKSIHSRLIKEAISNGVSLFDEKVDLTLPADLKTVEPKGYDYTEVIVTMKKAEAK